MPDEETIEALLRELRDGQREALALQREQHEWARAHYERAARLQADAERLQQRSAAMVTSARRALVLLLPVIGALLAWLTWLIFR